MPLGRDFLRDKRLIYDSAADVFMLLGSGARGVPPDTRIGR